MKKAAERIDKIFKIGEKVIVTSDDIEAIGNPSVIYKDGIIIAVNKKMCIEFVDRIIGGHSGNELGFFGKPFSCYWVAPKFIDKYSKELLDELEARKEERKQQIIDEWYGPESYA